MKTITNLEQNLRQEHLKPVENIALHSRSKKSHPTFMSVNIPADVELFRVDQAKGVWSRFIRKQVYTTALKPLRHMRVTKFCYLEVYVKGYCSKQSLKWSEMSLETKIRSA